MPAKHSLAQVKKLVNEFLMFGKDTVWFSAASRSIDPVMNFYPDFSADDAVRFILNGILQLVDEDYCFSNLQWQSQNLVADVYGFVYDGKPWFVKFMIENECLEEISFHPPEKPLTTAGGKIIPGVQV